MPTSWESNLLTMNILFIIDIFYLSGEPISTHLLRYSGIRGEIPRLHPPSLASRAISTREYQVNTYDKERE